MRLALKLHVANSAQPVHQRPFQPRMLLRAGRRLVGGARGAWRGRLRRHATGGPVQRRAAGAAAGAPDDRAALLPGALPACALSRVRSGSGVSPRSCTTARCRRCCWGTRRSRCTASGCAAGLCLCAGATAVLARGGAETRLSACLLHAHVAPSAPSHAPKSDLLCDPAHRPQHT